MGIVYYLVCHEQKKIFYLGKNAMLRWFGKDGEIDPATIVSVIALIDNLRELCDGHTHLVDIIYTQATTCREVYQTNPGAVLLSEAVIDTYDDWWNAYEKDW